MKKKILLSILAILFTFKGYSQNLEEVFLNPPQDARPLMIWQWMDGLVTQEGITRDLEAYAEAKLGGVQQFLVGGPEQGGVRDTTNAIGTEQWRLLMRHAISECRRLGLSFGTHNCPGWSSSGFPTVEPAYSMQQLVWKSDTIVASGRKAMNIVPKRPDIDLRYDYYCDISVLAMPIDSIVKWEDVIDLTGIENYKLPKGSWLVIRFGHTTNGKTNGATAPYGGVGLECDKMSREAVLRYWQTYPQMLIDIAQEATPDFPHTFQRIEIDSYEAGGQSWTARMPEEFLRRRGYDLTKWLPVLAGYTVESKERSKQFFDDFAKTGTELFTENYYGYMAELAHQSGLRLLYQPYGTNSSKPFNPINTEAIAKLLPNDYFCTEFWTKPTNWGWPSVPRHTQTAHRLGIQRIFAEGFTHWPFDAWQEDPASQKILADRAFCLGVNSLMLHAGAQNPWKNVVPGMTFGKWGSWWTPGQTWWRSGAAKLLFQYMSRCQALLQQGRWIDDFRSSQPSLRADTPSLQWTHRRKSLPSPSDGSLQTREQISDIYFISNPVDSAFVTTITIAVADKLPELWLPDTGEQMEISNWQTDGDSTRIALHLDENQSVFVILQKPTTNKGNAIKSPVLTRTDIQTIGGLWTLQFPDGWDAPESVTLDSLIPWNEHHDVGIRYFSGTATYSKTIHFKHIDKSARYVLDLGMVKNTALVTLNGKSVAHLWKKPFRCDITPYIKKGDNHLEIAVTNLWPNRMIGDEQYEDDIEWEDPFAYNHAPGKPVAGQFMKRIPEWLSEGKPRPSQHRKTVVSFKFFHKDSPLLTSGLLGPVMIETF